ncbi:signal peptide-containing protein [Theileria equi strain WA]|uniref:Signal peptide-containing protein n=1 Tax=Theileria equi strain WA TaxID=1537102 RepID=L0AYW2_THEEQ|nr:signal peptide-containing protein [Theileria equi strain WA]AFZ80084.1 signal peptide-containing protein [Theileria equi strain WA]|eukprot:XP_004829750.1 signal peptide-containing protein [Theileria equi strain WA]
MHALLVVPLLTIFLSTRTVLAARAFRSDDDAQDIIHTTQHYDVEAIYPKIPITLNLAREAPAGITRVERLATSSESHFMIKPQYDEYYKIGDILENRAVIVEGNTNIAERRVYLRDDGKDRILRVTDFYLQRDGRFRTETIELVKVQGDAYYGPLMRCPVDLHLLSRDMPDEIERITDPSRGETRYRIRKNMMYTMYIGTVIYGEDVLDDAVGNDILSKEVTVDFVNGLKRVRVDVYKKDGSFTSSEHTLR